MHVLIFEVTAGSAAFLCPGQHLRTLYWHMVEEILEEEEILVREDTGGCHLWHWA
jgi:hypothetical protein